MSRPLEIASLEEAEFSKRRIVNEVTRAFPNANVRTFETRLELEGAWANRYRPDAVIIDLLVPEKYLGLVRFLLGRSQGFKNTLLRPLRLTVRFLVLLLFGGPRYIAQLKGNLMEGRDPFWGGVEFLRTRYINNDQNGVRFYIYSISANQEATERDGLFGPIAARIMKYVNEELANRLKIKIFSKGFVPSMFNIYPTELVGDELQELVTTLRQDLQPVQS